MPAPPSMDGGVDQVRMSGSVEPRRRIGRAAGEVPDAELLRRLASGELSTLGTLYDRYQDDVRQFIAYALSSREEADDLAQEVFLTLPSAAASYDGRLCARPFLLGIAAQLVRRRRRALARWSDAISAFALTLAGASLRTPEDATTDAQRMSCFEGALARLTEDKRLVFIMIEREGLSGEDVSKALDIPLGTVWTRMLHARMEIRRTLIRRGAL